MIDKKSANFILFNNRSREGVISNFLSIFEVNIMKLLDIETNLYRIKKQKNYNKHGIVIPKEKLNLEAEDVRVYPSDRNLIQESLINANKNIKGTSEYEWLKKRSFDDSWIEKYKIGALSTIKDIKHLEIIGATTHPMLYPLLGDSNKNQEDFVGITIPFIDANNYIENVVVRRLKGTLNRMKFCILCPEIFIWNYHSINQEDEFWITEGVFDSIAIIEKTNEKSISISNPAFSSIQYYNLFKRNPKHIKIFADSDFVGLKNAQVLSEMFDKYEIKNTVYISKYHKDAYEHFVENKRTTQDLEKIKITKDIIKRYDTEDRLDKKSMDFVNFIENRVL